MDMPWICGIDLHSESRRPMGRGRNVLLVGGLTLLQA